jgi:DNA-binding beta-propeller fold protein YncE
MVLISQNSSYATRNNNSIYYIEREWNNIDKYFKLSNKVKQEIDSDSFYREIYGIGYKKVLAKFGFKPLSVDYDAEGNIYVCFFQESLVYKLNKEGNILKIYEEMGKIDTIYDIAIEGEMIWCVYPTSHTIKKFALQDGRLLKTISEGDIGDEFGSIFTYPEDITIKDNYLYVSDMGNQRICSVNLITNEVKEYLKLKSNVFGFEKTDDMECIWLGNGCNMYLIDGL